MSSDLGVSSGVSSGTTPGGASGASAPEIASTGLTGSGPASVRSSRSAAGRGTGGETGRDRGRDTGRDTRRRLDAWLGRRGLADASVRRLVQDAGERVYFRVRPPSAAGNGAAPASTVRSAAAEGDRGIAARPGGFVACVMAAPYAPGSLPFANAAALYREMAVPGPEVLEETPEAGIVALEDLGDDLLQIVAARDPAAAAPLYGEAVDLIARIQREGARVGASAAAGRYRAFGMRLDEELFVRELRFFVEHFVVGHLAVRPGAAFLGHLDGLLRELAAEAAATPSALCHRDYHSRNLIAVPARPGGSAAPAAPGQGGVGAPEGAELRVIDHQDTRLGPRTYDLMSLVRDPYITPAAESDLGVAAGDAPTPPRPEPDLTARFREAAGVRESPAALVEEQDTVALQRHLKALGTYGYARKRNPVYRRFIAPTLAMVGQNLERHPDRPPRRLLHALLSDLTPLD